MILHSCSAYHFAETPLAVAAYVGSIGSGGTSLLTSTSNETSLLTSTSNDDLLAGRLMTGGHREVKFKSEPFEEALFRPRFATKDFHS